MDKSPAFGPLESIAVLRLRAVFKEAYSTAMLEF
jgi:hypothetical protein